MTIFFLKFPLVPTLGGAEFHTLQLARYFTASGHRVKLITSDQYLFRLFEKNNLTRKRLFVGWEPTGKWSLLLWPLTFLIARRKLKKIIRAAPPDSIFFCQSLTEKLILPALLTAYGLPLTTVFFLEHKIPGKWLKFNPLKFLYLKKTREVKLITVSNFAKQEFMKFGVGQKNIEVIYPSITPAIASPPRRTKQSQFTIGILGRLDPEKAVLNFLQSVIPGLPARSEASGEGGIRNPSWKILIAGRGKQEHEIKDFISIKNLESRIKILEFVYNLDEFFSQISVLAYPTKVPESFGLSILEALSRGIPVIANNLGAIPEIIKHGENGYLISPPRDPFGRTQGHLEQNRNGGGETQEGVMWTKYLESLQTPSTYQNLSASALITAQSFSETKMFEGFNRLIT